MQASPEHLEAVTHRIVRQAAQQSHHNFPLTLVTLITTAAVLG